VIAGTSRLDITPLPGAELSGFAARIQPSTGILDPLHARGLYLEDGGERLLWLHTDLVGVERALVLEMRRWAHDRLGIAGDRVMLSATHTHSGPCTVRLLEAGAYDPAYVEFLRRRLRDTAIAAAARTGPCVAVACEGLLDLAVDRRRKASSRTDPRIAAVGLRRPDGTFAAVLVNHPMHAVALGAANRQASADVPGQAALALERMLPGAPEVLVTNGACGNLNPPGENVPFAQVRAWGRDVAEAVAPGLLRAPPAGDQALRVLSRLSPLPVEALDAGGIETFARKALGSPGPLAEWGDKYRRAVETWRRSMLQALQEGRTAAHRDAELFSVRIAGRIFLGVNAEMFSEFTDLLRADTGALVSVVGYANGLLGYVPTRAAYAEGGYEVDTAHIFYGDFRPQAGGLELLARKAADIIRDVSKPSGASSSGRLRP